MSGSVLERMGVARTTIVKIVRRLVRWAINTAVVAVLLCFTILLVWAFDARRMPDLQVWHEARLDEFTVRDEEPDLSLADYMRFEQRVFDDLEGQVLQQVEPTKSFNLSRYVPGGNNNPIDFPRNWNRTFELKPDEIRGGVLLLHGLTDSPYSLRRVGEIFADHGFYTLGLRLPGHGTIPGALESIRWEDWLAATRVGARHVAEQAEGKGPFFVVGYSNGGALAVKYTMDAIEQSVLPKPERLILFSPAIGITRWAALTNWHQLLSWIPYFEKAKWVSILPEIDPFKYNSLPKNAGRQTHELTLAVQAQFDRLKREGRVSEMPPLLAFQSLVDTTVLTDAIVKRLYNRLESDGSELVLFDLNRVGGMRYLMTAEHATLLDNLEESGDLPYRLTVIANVSEGSFEVSARTKAPRSQRMTATNLGLEWPVEVYSLSHIAIPFAPDDPLYGRVAHPERGLEHGLPLGALQPRGERDLLRPSLSYFMRLRHNPFFEYINGRLLEVLETTEPDG
jgi:alpha-beta hydrolase superfamily lysophospholipase